MRFKTPGEARIPQSLKAATAVVGGQYKPHDNVYVLAILLLPKTKTNVVSILKKRRFSA
ncbi:MAG TPA: hypothetical protein V6D14_07610 [Coleofasciculaceae cyanobacterium]|jgi:hypothetical protein